MQDPWHDRTEFLRIWANEMGTPRTIPKLLLPSASENNNGKKVWAYPKKVGVRLELDVVLEGEQDRNVPKGFG